LGSVGGFLDGSEKRVGGNKFFSNFFPTRKLFGGRFCLLDGREESDDTCSESVGDSLNGAETDVVECGTLDPRYGWSTDASAFRESRLRETLFRSKNGDIYP
jgi:hypothetical protein